MGGRGRGGASNGGAAEVADAEACQHGVDKEIIYQGRGEQGFGAN